jgi:hypothetical protein
MTHHRSQDRADPEINRETEIDKLTTGWLFHFVTIFELHYSVKQYYPRSVFVTGLPSPARRVRCHPWQPTHL